MQSALHTEETHMDAMVYIVEVSWGGEASWNGIAQELFR